MKNVNQHYFNCKSFLCITIYDSIFPIYPYLLLTLIFKRSFIKQCTNISKFQLYLFSLKVEQEQQKKKKYNLKKIITNFITCLFLKFFFFLLSSKLTF